MGNRSYWESTRQLLLVVEFDTLVGIHAYRNAIKSVGLNVNDCVVLVLVSSKKERQILTQIHSVVYASIKEINILGRWKNEEALKTLGQFFDVLLVIGEQSPKVTKQLKKVKNSISVGVNTNADFLTIDLKSEQTSPDQLLSFVKQTLEKII